MTMFQKGILFFLLILIIWAVKANYQARIGVTIAIVGGLAYYAVNKNKR